MSELPANCRSREVSLTSVVLSSIVSVMIAIAYIVMRWGLDTTTVPATLKTLGLALLLLNLPVFLNKMCYRWSIPGSLTSLTVLTLFSIAGIGWCLHRWEVTESNVSWAISGTGFVLFGLQLIMWLIHRRVFSTLVFLIYAVVFGCTVSFMVFSDGVHRPLFIESLRQGDYHHVDPFFHAALANMLDLHGSCSTGLDGLVPLKYHVGSHWLLIVLGKLTGIGPLDAHQILFPIIFLPLFVFALLMLAQSCQVVHGGSECGRRQDGLFWMLFTLGTLGVLPLAIGLDVRLCLISTTVSESQVISLALLAMLVAFCLHVYGVLLRSMGHSLDYLLMLIIVPGLFAYLTFTKISVPMVMFPVAAVAFWRLRLYRHWCWISVVVISAVLCAMIFQGAVNTTATEQQKTFPLAYVFYNIPRQWWGLFFPVLLLWSGWYCWSRCRQQQINTLRDLWQAVLQRRIVDVECLVVMVIVGFGPAMLYAYDGVAYFFNYQRWLGLPLVLGCMGWWRTCSREQTASPVAGDGLHTPGFGSIRIATLFSGFIFLCLMIIQGVNAYQSWQRYTQELLQGRAVSSQQAKAWLEEAHVAFRRFQFPQIVRLIRQAIACPPATTGRRSIELLVELGRLPRHARREAMVYVPKHNRDFWELITPGPERQGTAFIPPALSGIVQLEGIPEYDSTIAWNYLGFDDYHVDQPRPPQKPWREDLDALKKRTAAMGFKTLYVLDQDAAGKVYLEKVECP